MSPNPREEGGLGGANVANCHTENAGEASANPWPSRSKSNINLRRQLDCHLLLWLALRRSQTSSVCTRLRPFSWCCYPRILENQVANKTDARNGSVLFSLLIFLDGHTFSLVRLEGMIPKHSAKICEALKRCCASCFALQLLLSRQTSLTSKHE